MRQTSSDIVIGVGLLLFCAFAAWRTLRIKVPPEATIAGTSFFPWLMIGGIALLSLGLIARALLRTGAVEMIQVPDRMTLAKIGLLALLMVAYAAVFMKVGYIPSTLIVFVGGLLLFKERRIFVLIVFPIVTTGAIYLGFTRVLGVWLP
jgi:putative tricarboxylic transport membrane protein